MEFWTGLLFYARQRSAPCLKDQGLCTCDACEQLHEMYVRAAAIAAAGQSPGDHVPFQIRLAS
jgi:hypothetical protein